MPQKLLLLLALVPVSPALAHRSARLLDDTPRLASVEPSTARLVRSEALAAQEEVPPGPSAAAHLVSTWVPGVFASTASVLLATGLGSLSNNLLGAALPALLSHLLVGPLLTTLAALVVGNHGSERYGFWGPALAAFLVHAATFAVASLALVVAWSNPVSLLAYTAADALLMTAASVSVMRLFPRRAPTELPAAPGAPMAQAVSLARLELE